MSEQELPPWLREQVARLQQLQQNLQAIMMQKQQVELEVVETDRALEEIRKAGVEDVVYKSAGPLLIKSKKDNVIKELEEKGARTAIIDAILASYHRGLELGKESEL